MNYLSFKADKRAKKLRLKNKSYREIGEIMGCSHAQAWTLVNKPYKYPFRKRTKNERS